MSNIISLASSSNQYNKEEYIRILEESIEYVKENPIDSLSINILSCDEKMFNSHLGSYYKLLGMLEVSKSDIVNEFNEVVAEDD